MSSVSYDAALAEVEAAAARVAPHLQAQGGQVQAAGFLGGFGAILLGIFLDALKDQLVEEARKAGVDVVTWVVSKIRGYFKEDPKPATGEMRIMPHIPAGADAAGAEQILTKALSEFLPVAEAASLAKSVRAAINA